MDLEVDLEREQDIEELRRVALALHAQTQQLIRQLKKKCDQLAFYTGNKEELQATLALIEQLEKQSADAANPKPTPPKPEPRKEPQPRKRTGPTPQPNLPRMDLVCMLDEPDLACRACGGGLRPMADQFDASEMIDVVEVSYRLVQVKQQKYTCKCGGCIETAPGPQRAVAGSRYSLAFAIKVIIDKYLDHIPLERQTRILERHGLVVTSSTLWDLAYAVAQRLSIVDAALGRHVLEQPVIGLDQTSWPRLENASSKPWQMWVLTAPGVVVHRIRDDKSAATFKALVGDYKGVIIADAASSHEAGARASPDMRLAGCWAHVFRRFEEALENHPAAEKAVAWIRALYDIDSEAGADMDRRAILRRERAPQILDDMKAWLWKAAENKAISLGEAAAYTLGIWERLTLFVDDHRIPLDNNATERAIRGPVVGRKNHYGSKSRSGTVVASTLYSLIETCKLHAIDPAAYLHEAATLAERGEVLLPWDFKPRA